MIGAGYDGANLTRIHALLLLAPLLPAPVAGLRARQLNEFRME
jgi:hypothetical protein